MTFDPPCPDSRCQVMRFSVKNHQHSTFLNGAAHAARFRSIPLRWVRFSRLLVPGVVCIVGVDRRGARIYWAKPNCIPQSHRTHNTQPKPAIHQVMTPQSPNTSHTSRPTARPPPPLHRSLSTPPLRHHIRHPACVCEICALPALIHRQPLTTLTVLVLRSPVR